MQINISINFNSETSPNLNTKNCNNFYIEPETPQNEYTVGIVIVENPT